MSLIIHCSFTFSSVCYSYNQTIWRKKRSCTKKLDIPLLRHFSQRLPNVGDLKLFAGKMKKDVFRLLWDMPKSFYH